MIYTASHHITPDFFVSKIQNEFKSRIGESYDKYYEKGHTYRPFDFASVLFLMIFDLHFDLSFPHSLFSQNGH